MTEAGKSPKAALALLGGFRRAGLVYAIRRECEAMLGKNNGARGPALALVCACPILAALWCARGADKPTQTANGAAANAADRVWNENKRDVQQHWPAAAMTQQQANDLWGDTMSRCERRFRSLLRTPDRRTLIARFVRHFGTEGDEADFAWLVSFYGGMVDYAPRFTSVFPRKGEAELLAREAQLTIAETQTHMFLAKKDLLRRYSHVYLWCGALRGFMSTMCVAAMRKRIGSEEYWWYARNFLVMAHLTGRDDLLAGSKPEELEPVFWAWYRWYRRSGGYLRFDTEQKRWLVDPSKRARMEVYVPFVQDLELPPYEPARYPFPNWKGRKPCSPKLLAELW